MESVINSLNVFRTISKETLWKNFISYSKIITIALFSIYIIGLFTIAGTSPESLMSKPFTIIIFVMIPIICIGYLYLKLDEITIESEFMIGAIGVVVLLFVGFFLFFIISTPKDNTTSKFLSYFSIFSSFLIAIVGLIIYYNIFKNTIKKQSGWSGFFSNLVFYIPCLITDYFQYLFMEVKNTPSIVFIFFIIEIILVLLYIYIPIIINALFIPTGFSILNKPVYLSPEKDIANSDIFIIDAPVSIKDEKGKQLQIYNSNFSLSMWIFINTTILGTKEQETTIFKYGNITDFYGKPSITYLGNDDWRFMLTNNTGYSDDVNLKYVALPEYIVKMPSQKWHHIVFTYYDNHVDLFINGSLARNMNLSSRLPIKNLDDKITIGSDDVKGAICNINYYKFPLNDTQISRMYNMLFMLNPPVNNLQ